MNDGERTAKRTTTNRCDDRLPPVGSEENIDYANRLLNNCLRFYTLDQIAAHTGICRRLLSYMRHRGVNNYANQIALEILAGAKLLVEK